MKTMNEYGSMLGLMGAWKPGVYANMKMQANKSPYLSLLIGGVTVILLGSAVITAAMALMPTSTDEESDVATLDKLATSPATAVAAQEQIPSARAEGDAHVRVKCAECGVVESSREIEPFVVVGVVAGKASRSHEVTVHMKDGSNRVFVDSTPANWRAGERVTFIEGANRSHN